MRACVCVREFYEKKVKPLLVYLETSSKNGNCVDKKHNFFDIKNRTRIPLDCLPSKLVVNFSETYANENGN